MHSAELSDLSIEMYYSNCLDWKIMPVSRSLSSLLGTQVLGGVGAVLVEEVRVCVLNTKPSYSFQQNNQHCAVAFHIDKRELCRT